MSNVVAGIGRGQLMHLNTHKRLKEQIYCRYTEGFIGLPVKMNPYLECSSPNFWLSCITINPEAMSICTPEKIRLTLEQQNIESRRIWKPMHLQPLFADRSFINVDGTEVSKDIFERGICLPSDIKMTVEDQEMIISCIRELFR